MQALPTCYADLFNIQISCQWIHLLSSSECAYRQALIFPSPAKPDSHAFKVMDNHPLYVVLELQDGRCLKVMCDDQHGRVIKPQEIARLILARPELAFTEDLHDEAASFYLSEKLGLRIIVGPVNFTAHIHNEDTLNITDIVLSLNRGNAVAREWKSAINDAMGHFRRNLSQTLLNALQDEQWQDSRAYNWLQSDPKMQYRMQALEVQPLLGKNISTPNFSDRWLLDSLQFESKKIKGYIDQGYKLHEFVANTLQIPTETVRWLGNKPLSLIGHEWASNPEHLYTLLVCMLPEKRPNTVVDWQIMTQLAQAMLWIPNSRLSSILEEWMCAFALQGWSQCAKKLERMRATPMVFSLAHRYLYALFDYLCEVKGEDLAFIDCKTQASSPWGWLKQAQTWQQAIDAEEHLLFSPDARWPSLLHAPQSIGQFNCTELNTGRDLKLEGETQQHCVGTYIPSCQFGQAHIVSLHNLETHERSTVHLQLNTGAGGITVSVVEHTGSKNNSPSLAAESALQTVLTELNERALQTRLLQVYEDAELRIIQRPIFDCVTYGKLIIKQSYEC